jgi:N-acetylglucosaminyldiphosphoundecaprenol N-acetyl-beta-D-mannosaminyltransferase
MPGPVFLLHACNFGQSYGWRHFFYGGAPGVPEKLAATLQKHFPRLQVAGCWSPPFRPLTPQEESSVKCMIETAQTDVLWVALGSPHQELWAFDHVPALNVPFIFPVGAAFDFHAGIRPWAPKLIRELGMEWLFQAFTGGKRMFVRTCYFFPRVSWLICFEFGRRLLRA